MPAKLSFAFEQTSRHEHYPDSLYAVDSSFGITAIVTLRAKHCELGDMISLLSA